MDEQQRKQMIQQAFDTVAGGYDHPSLAFFPQTAAKMIELLQPPAHAQLLDVCTGTGVVALAAAEKMHDGKVTGVDLSAAMLAQAKNKADARGLNNIEFVHSDLENLEYPAQHFDLVTSSFGLFFMSDMTSALQHMLNMLKPGGRIAISSFVDAAFSPVSDIFLQRYEAYGREVPPLSWKRLSNEQLLSELFAHVGITEVSYHHLPLGFALKSVDAWWDIVWNAGFRGLLNQLDEQEQARFRDEHFDEINQLCKQQDVWVDTGVIIAIAHKD